MRATRMCVDNILKTTHGQKFLQYRVYVHVLCMQGTLAPSRVFDSVFIIRRPMHDKPGSLFRGWKVTRLDLC